MTTEYKMLYPGQSIVEFFGEKHGWPTVVAIRDGKLIGAISTFETDFGIACGPVKVVTRNPGHVTLKLINTYERALAFVGASAYYFYVDKEDPGMDKWLRSVSPFSEKVGNDGWRQRILVSKRAWSQTLRRERERATTH